MTEAGQDGIKLLHTSAVSTRVAITGDTLTGNAGYGGLLRLGSALVVGNIVSGDALGATTAPPAGVLVSSNL